LNWPDSRSIMDRCRSHHKTSMILRFLFACGLSVFAAVLVISCAVADEPLAVKVGFLRHPHLKETVSILDIPAADDGFAGAKLAALDNNTTGRFLNQTYSLEDKVVNEGDDPVAALQQLTEQGVKLVLADLPAGDLLKIADAAKGKDVLIFNTTAREETLREENCRANVIHTAPSYSMLADGLAEYLIWKRWPRWFLMKGSHDEDELFATAIRHAAKKFGAKIVEERTYEDTGGGRRSDSGSVQTQRLIPVATQNAPAYDVLVAADESEVFAAYLPYHTWDPRPVAGSAGLVPTSWDAAHEQWGALQLQNRFMKLNNRRMNDRDANAWLAMRMIGEAVSRIKSNDPKAIRDFLVSPAFSIAAFKGDPLTVRTWNQQVRQPILLSDGHVIVSVSPQEGFLHQTSVLDTLGYDKPETKCKLQ
jgi:ABC transporter substrate binding protein (PQQ-dependent alcohol dehydrogenase system)